MAYYEIYLYNGDDPKILIASSDYNPGILNPIVEKEVNTSGSLSFNVLPTHPQHDEFYRFKTRLDVVINDQVIFRGRVTSIAEDFYKQKSIECEGALGYLNDGLYVFLDDENHGYNKKNIKVYEDAYWYLWLLFYNTQYIAKENWKEIKLGLYENPGSENIFAPKIIIDGFYDRDDDFRPSVPGGMRRASTDLIEINDDYLYYLSIGSSYYDNVLHNQQGGIWRINFYDENREFIPFLRDSWGVDRQTLPNWTLPDNSTEPYPFGKFTLKDFWDPENDVRKIGKKPTYFRISISTPTGFIDELNPPEDKNAYASLWIQYVDNETNSFAYNDYTEINTYDTIFNTISSAIVDGRTNFIRTRVYKNKVYLDYLNGNRTIYDDAKPGVYSAPNTHELEFSVNILDMSFEDTGIEPYSCIVPISNGIGYFDTDLLAYAYVKNQRAFELYGYIHKPLDVGSADGAQISKKTALKRAEKYMKLYDPMIPDSITIKALDKGVFFDTERFQMIDVGDAVHVVSEPHGIDKSLICLSLKFDIMNPQNNEYKIGKYIPEGDDYKIKNLTDSFSKSKKK